jgi:hypothetical protein
MSKVAPASKVVSLRRIKKLFKVVKIIGPTTKQYYKGRLGNVIKAVFAKVQAQEI